MYPRALLAAIAVMIVAPATFAIMLGGERETPEMARVAPMLRASAEEAGQYLMSATPRDANIYYATLYESDGRRGPVRVNVPTTGKSAILWLNSYEPVDWRVASDDPVAAVVISSHDKKSTVRGVGNARVMQLDKRWTDANAETRSCTCSQRYFHCEDKQSLGEDLTRLGALSGRSVAGYTTAYSAADILFTPYTVSVAERLSAIRAKEEILEQGCRRS